jgi:CubicO group peptidase (beta-lactamase class C family)
MCGVTEVGTVLSGRRDQLADPASTEGPTHSSQLTAVPPGRTPEISPPAVIADVVEKGIKNRWHTGAQLFVAVDGEPIVNWAVGDASLDMRMTTRTRLPWACCGKPLVAVALAQMVEAGDASWTDPLVSWLPELAGSDKEEITIEDVLTYRSGIPDLPTFPERSRALAEIADATLQFRPRTSCVYIGWSDTFLLSEILRRAYELEPLEVLRRNIFQAAGMDLATAESASSNRAMLFNTAVDPPVRLGWYETAAAARPEWAVVSIQGSAVDLGMFHVSITRQDSRLIAPETLELMLRPRVRHMPWLLGSPPSPFQWGLGFVLGCHAWLPSCSRNTFGQFGAEITFVVVDRERDVVVAFAANGMPGAMASWARAHEITSAVFAVCDS